MQEQHELLLERARLHAGQHENGSYEQYGHSNGHSHAGPSGEDAEEDPILLHVLEAAGAEVEKLGEQLAAAQRGFARVRHFFGVPKSVADDALLPLFASFLDAYKRAIPPPKAEKKAAPRRFTVQPGASRKESAAASANSGSGDGHTAMSGAVVAGADASLHTPHPADGVPIRIRKT